MLTGNDTIQNEVALSYHRVRGLFYTAVIFGLLYRNINDLRISILIVGFTFCHTFT